MSFFQHGKPPLKPTHVVNCFNNNQNQDSLKKCRFLRKSAESAHVLDLKYLYSVVFNLYCLQLIAFLLTKINCNINLTNARMSVTAVQALKLLSQIRSHNKIEFVTFAEPLSKMYIQP